MKAYLHLEDGTIIAGEQFGYRGQSDGEVVFSTGMTGYCESLTDPSFAGQILTFTYPTIGNYGVPKPKMLAPGLLANFESERIWVSGVIVSSYARVPSHWASVKSIDTWLAEEKVSGIAGVDTRALTQKLRETGVMRGRISLSQNQVDWKSVNLPTDVVRRVSAPGVYTYKPTKPNGKHVLVIDCGVKHGILRAILAAGYRITRIPFDADPRPYLHRVDGVIVSNGPGDPKDCQSTILNIRKVLVAGLPYLGICLGHQLLALAIGADTYKLRYGHRGLNQPVKDIFSGRCSVTSQNHGYAVDPKTIPTGFIPWFRNLNDDTNEGLRHTVKPIRSIQFHPEGNPGPNDTNWVFDVFLQ